MIRNELSALTNGALQYEPGGYRVHFDTRTAFKRNTQGSGSGNRSFKNTPGSGRNQGNGGNQRGSYGNGGGSNTGYGNNAYNKNRKFNKNKSK